MYAHPPPTPPDRQAGPHRTLPGRRAALAQGVALLLGPGPLQAQPALAGDGERWYAAAAAMRAQALSWGDQPYGAVLVQGGRIIGNGPSRVVKNRNPDAHAEREALRDALERWGPDAVRGAVLYSTSQPCAACERAAARAGVARMVFGETLVDGGVPALR